jgi:hypothetical protein
MLPDLNSYTGICTSILTQQSRVQKGLRRYGFSLLAFLGEKKKRTHTDANAPGDSEKNENKISALASSLSPLAHVSVGVSVPNAIGRPGIPWQTQVSPPPNA